MAAIVIIFYFIRHGNINRLGNESDPALTPLGIAEAEAAARQLARGQVDRVYASDLRRARETAQIVAGPHGLTVIQDLRLRERANFGALPGQSVDDFVSMWERCNVERSWVPPIGDSSQRCGERVEAFIADCTERWLRGTVIAASHGGTIADFLLNVFSQDDIAAVNPALAATPFSGNVMRECSITVVCYDGTGYSLIQAANVDHLPETEMSRET